MDAFHILVAVLTLRVAPQAVCLVAVTEKLVMWGLVCMISADEDT